MTKFIPIVALVAYKGTGKSTLARKIIEQVEAPWHRMAIAAPLKDAIKAMAGRPNMDLDDPDVKAGRLWPSAVPTATVRKALEGIGNVIRTLDEDYWVQRLDERLEALPAGHGPVIIDDLNFPNELAYLQGRGAMIVYVYREAVAAKNPGVNGPSGPGSLPLQSDNAVARMLHAGAFQDAALCVLGDELTGEAALMVAIRKYLRYHHA